ncbi:choice-of-anchor K domain-containing protein [Streptomyces marincola]|uniref:choice-of-anchor K domain-containing protein n=1 Tax=Streptomyces marincola TaxID=2878388 RepID=UPI001CF1E045|nr:choice-of-anchor K domain-containing protein [Streptomyces marincola]UCM86647.1 choice-of-anchor K domain-containing protein [Streptomyces marincola]
MVAIQTRGIWQNPDKDASYFTGLGSEHLSWGTPVDSEQSAYRFKGNSAVADIDGPAVVLGTFTHYNFRVQMPFTRFQVELKVTVTVEGGIRRQFTLPFSHYESPNRGPVHDDEVGIGVVAVKKAVEIDDVECDMKVTGFYQSLLSDEVTETFISPEDQSNSGQLLVQFTRYDGPL